MHRVGLYMSVKRHELLESLFHELFQTEHSAAKHPMREAGRLGAVPPARTLRAVGEHAQRALASLPPVAKECALPVSGRGSTLGRLFSRLRQLVLDRVIDSERSYRGTLLGLRHGVDLVRLVREVADREGLDALVQWCDDWLIERAPLVEHVAGELAWFAEEPTVALLHPGQGAKAS
jgi:hypothetical protein